MKKVALIVCAALAGASAQWPGETYDFAPYAGAPGEGDAALGGAGPAAWTAADALQAARQRVTELQLQLEDASAELADLESAFAPSPAVMSFAAQSAFSWAPYESATGCTSGPTPGARALQEWFAANVPRGWSGGIYNCRSVRGSSSPSLHGEGRALDWMLPVVNGRGHADGHVAIRRLGPHARALGIQAIIFDKQIWSARNPSGGAYSGVNPHYDHLHIELTRSAGSSLTLARINSILGGGSPVSSPTPAPTTTRPTLRRGDRSDAVRELQRLLRIPADGIFGAQTEDAVRNFQRANGLAADGIVGPRTWAALLR